LIEIFTGLLVFSAVIGGLGLAGTATLPFKCDERVMLAPLAGCIMVYLAAGAIYCSGLPAAAFWALPVAAAGALAWRWTAVRTLVCDAAAGRLLGLWLILAGWCLGLLALVRSYSGGEWVGDWIEHYQRARFFLERQPLDTMLLHAPLPARPPLANLVEAALLGLTKTSFAQYQIFSTLLATLAFFPAALLARRFARGTDPAAALLVLLMLSPLFVQNATFAWTKLPAAAFTLAGLYFFLRAGRADARRGKRLSSELEAGSPVAAVYDRRNDSVSQVGDAAHNGGHRPPLQNSVCAQHDSTRSGCLSLRCAALCLAVAVLTHYSAVPYVLVLGAAWFVQRRAQWRQAGFWREALRLGALGSAVLATWFGWSLLRYGPGPTFLSNTTVTGNAGLTLAQQIAQRAGNLFTTLVPHPLRPAGYEFVQQTSSLSWWRDYFFNLYQTNLPLAFGSGGLVALVVLGWRRRRELTTFWVWTIGASVLLSIGVVSLPDRWGVAHVGLQPLVLLGLAWLAAQLPALGRAGRALLATGLTLDFGLGIASHFWVQHLAFSADMFARHRDQFLLSEHGYATWNNFLSKCALGLTFVGDLGVPALPLVALLAVLLGLALRHALRSTPCSLIS
jgi:hypothetical protein